MARTELPNGIILPAEYSDDWYDDMTSNLSKLDEVIGSDAEKLSEEDVGAAALSNDYTDLDNKPALKPVATSGDYDDLDNKPALKPVATSGDYDDLDNKPALKPVATSGDYDDLDNKPALKPVATSGDYDDLDNKPALKPVATSGDYDDLTDLPTYGITRLCSSAITDNSSVAFSNISSTDKIKVGDFLLDTNGKLYQISSVDTATETVSVTTPLTQLAVDSSVVHNTGNENVNGTKTFKDMIPIDGDYLGDEASNNQRTNICLRSNRDTAGKSCAYISRFRQNKSQGALQTGDLQMISFDVLENEVRKNNVFSIQCSGWVDDVPTKVRILSTISDSTFGSSTRPSKINDINPGALSLPDLSNGIDISGYITLNSDSSYTPLIDGYVYICCYSSAACGLWVRDSNNNGVSTRSIGSVPTYNNLVSMCIPVVKNVSLSIFTPGCENILTAKFYPCLGNV